MFRCDKEKSLAAVGGEAPEQAVAFAFRPPASAHPWGRSQRARPSRGAGEGALALRLPRAPQSLLERQRHPAGHTLEGNSVSAHLGCLPTVERFHLDDGEDSKRDFLALPGSH